MKSTRFARVCDIKFFNGKNGLCGAVMGGGGCALVRSGNYFSHSLIYLINILPISIAKAACWGVVRRVFMPGWAAHLNS